MKKLKLFFQTFILQKNVCCIFFTEQNKNCTKNFFKNSSITILESPVGVSGSIEELISNFCHKKLV